MVKINEYIYEDNKIPLRKIDFRQSAAANEVVIYDNILIKNLNDEVLYENDFEDEMVGFKGEYLEHQDGTLRLGIKEGGEGDQLYIQLDKPIDEIITEITFKKTINLDDNPLSSKLYITSTSSFEICIDNDLILDIPDEINDNEGNIIKIYDLSSYITKTSHLLSLKTTNPTTFIKAKLIVNLSDGSINTIVTDSTFDKEVKEIHI